MGFESFPYVVGWELTLACNLRCGHCGSTAGEARPHELTSAEALGLCDQLPDLLVLEVDFTGGEPLLRPDLWSIAARLRELNIHTKVITNGLLLGPETVARMKDAGFARVGVSLDGLEATHDHIRQCPGLFRHVLAGIEEALRAGLPVTAITTVNALNIGQLPALFDLLHGLGVDMWQFQPLFPLGRARHDGELSLSPARYLQLGDFAREHPLSATGSQPTLLPGDSFGYYTDRDERQPPWGGCSAGLVLCGITSDGRIKGCLSMPDELAEGDLRRRDFWDIWFDPHAFRYNRAYSAADLGPHCRACAHAPACRGGCSSMSYACTGQMHNDPLCFHSLEHYPAGESQPPVHNLA